MTTWTNPASDPNGRADQKVLGHSSDDSSIDVRTRTAGVLRRIDGELENLRSATARRIVWDSLFAGWDDPDSLLDADYWVDTGDEDGPEEIVLTLIDEIRLGMSPAE